MIIKDNLKMNESQIKAAVLQELGKTIKDKPSVHDYKCLNKGDEDRKKKVAKGLNFRFSKCTIRRKLT